MARRSIVRTIRKTIRRTRKRSTPATRRLRVSDRLSDKQAFSPTVKDLNNFLGKSRSNRSKGATRRKEKRKKIKKSILKGIGNSAKLAAQSLKYVAPAAIMAVTLGALNPESQAVKMAIAAPQVISMLIDDTMKAYSKNKKFHSPGEQELKDMLPAWTPDPEMIPDLSKLRTEIESTPLLGTTTKTGAPTKGRYENFGGGQWIVDGKMKQD